MGQHDCPWDLGQLMGVGWVILDPPAGIASAVEWLVPMLDKVLRDLSPWSPPDAGHSGEEPAGGLRKARRLGSYCLDIDDLNFKSQLHH